MPDLFSINIPNNSQAAMSFPYTSNNIQVCLIAIKVLHDLNRKLSLTSWPTPSLFLTHSNSSSLQPHSYIKTLILAILSPQNFLPQISIWLFLLGSNITAQERLSLSNSKSILGHTLCFIICLSHWIVNSMKAVTLLSFLSVSVSNTQEFNNYMPIEWTHWVIKSYWVL